MAGVREHDVFVGDAVARQRRVAGHALAMLYAYRDADTSPVPVKMTFGAVGPSCFYLEDWINMGADPSQLNASSRFDAENACILSHAP